MKRKEIYRRKKGKRHLPDGYAEGVGVVEMVLILVVLLGLVVIFRTQLTALIRSIFSSVTNTVDQLL